MIVDRLQSIFSIQLQIHVFLLLTVHYTQTDCNGESFIPPLLHNLEILNILPVTDVKYNPY